MHKNYKEYHTKDLPVITILELKGNHAVEMYWQGKEAYFVFMGQEYCAGVAYAFYHDNIEDISLLSFLNKLKEIRNCIKNQKNKENGENVNEQKSKETWKRLL